MALAASMIVCPAMRHDRIASSRCSYFFPSENRPIQPVTSFRIPGEAFRQYRSGDWITASRSLVSSAGVKR